MKIHKNLSWIVGGLACAGTLAFAVLWWLSGAASIIPGAHDFSTRLPNGYFLTRVWSGSLSIYEDRDENRIVDPATEVGPSQYGILMAMTGRYIVGNLDTEEAAYQVPEVPDRYFIIDTQNDIITEELSFDEYQRRMHELGFETLPELIRPNKRTRFVK